MDFSVNKFKNNLSEKSKFYFTYKENNLKKVRVCKDCNTYEEAFAYASKIVQNKITEYQIKTITKDMFIPGSQHLRRMEMFGKHICDKTIYQKRQIIEEINKQFGNWQINKIQARDIESFLIMDSHSGSWKNFYMETFNQICDETKWLCHEPVNRFQFTKFARNSKKADVFTNSEITRLFSKRDWIFYRDYLLFLTMYCCGLRIGEVRALQVEQILENQFLLINGFCKYDGTKTNYNKTGSEEHPKLRACPIPDYCYSQLESFICNNNLKDKDFIFSNNGMPITQDYLDKMFKKMLAIKNIDTAGRKLIPHSLRFTYVTKLRCKLSVEDVQKIVGHATKEMTEYYTRNLLSEITEPIKSTLSTVNKVFVFN